MSAKVQENPKGSGKYYVSVTHNKKRKSMKCESKREAESFAREINKRIALGVFNLNEPSEKVKTFREYAKEWLDHNTIKASSQANYVAIFRHHVEPIIDKPINEITRLNVRDMLTDLLNDGTSISYCKTIKAFVSNVFNRAMDDGVVQANPAIRLGKLAPRKQLSHKSETKIRFIPPAELSKILDTLHKFHPEHYAYCLLLARAGLRAGEGAALQWGDVDFEKRVLHIRRARSRTVVDTPKSGKERTVDMSQQLAECLRKRRMDMLSAAVKTGKRNKWVFPGRRGEVMDHIHWKRNVWDKVIAKLGLPPYRVHDLRHSWASAMLALGYNLTFIQRSLGHSTIKITSDLYCHLMPDATGRTDGLDDVRIVDKDIRGKIVEKDIPKWKEL
jgi:integrase